MIYNITSGFQSFFSEIVTNTKRYMSDFWNALHGFLSQYMADNVIYLLIGSFLLIFAFIIILKAINHK